MIGKSDTIQTSSNGWGSDTPRFSASQLSPSQWLDVRWRLHGRALPIDHGFALFGALMRVLPWLHGNHCPVQIAPIRGRRDGRSLLLTGQSDLVIRAPAELLPQLLVLSRQRLEVASSVLHLDDARVESLRPAYRLHSRIVVIKAAGSARDEVESFWPALARQLVTVLGHDGAHVDLGERRVMRCHRYTVAGWPVTVSGLGEHDSIRLQSAGLGAKRHMGCGVLLPA